MGHKAFKIYYFSMVLILLAVLLSPIYLFNLSFGILEQTSWHKITHVEDGDTLKADGKWVRLLYVDTPEEDEEGYEKAKQWLKQYEGEMAHFRCEGEGYYDRKLCEVKVDGENLNNKLLELGLAEPYKK